MTSLWRHRDVTDFFTYPKPQQIFISSRRVVGLGSISFTFLKIRVANCSLSLYLWTYGGTTFDTNTHFLPIFRVSLQQNYSTKVNEILFGVSSIIYDYLYKFWALQFNRNIPFLHFEYRDFGKFYKFYIIYAGKLHCRNFVSAALRAAPCGGFARFARKTTANACQRFDSISSLRESVYNRGLAGVRKCGHRKCGHNFWTD